jgi:hypothetical protein
VDSLANQGEEFWEAILCKVLASWNWLAFVFGKKTNRKRIFCPPDAGLEALTM